MRTIEPEQQLETAPRRIFATTHWSVVQAAGENGSEPSAEALETLCDAYWSPIYVYVQRKGYGPDEAKDLTQEFFSQLIAKHQLRLADRNKGRFRSFLLSALHFFLAREWSRAHRQKRGGHYRFVSLDQPVCDDDLRFEPADKETPEKLFQRDWALTVLRQAMTALEDECARGGKAELFREVKPILCGERGSSTYTRIAERLSMTDGAVRVAVHRLRQRYGELLRTEVARTVDAEDEVEEELLSLRQALTE
jgi:DNA-directed RNA polymerase specialized sigma24 family protein